MGLPTLLALASLFSQRYSEYDETAFPNVKRGVDADVAAELQQPFDYVVVGSGFAGSFLARQLGSGVDCDRPPRVLVLEAGGLPSFDSVIPFTRLQDISDLEYGYMTVPQKKAAKAMKDNKVHLMIGKSMGGDAVVDSGLYLPPNLGDFHRWSYLYSLRGWGYQDMKPFMFKLPEEKERIRRGKRPEKPLKDFNMTRSEILHSLRRGIAPNLIEPLQFAWLHAGKKLNYSSVDGTTQGMFHDGGFFLPKTMAHNGIKLNPAAQFLRRLGKNLVVLCHAEVQKLLFAEDRRSVVGLQFKDTRTEKVYNVNVGKEVILTAGAIGSARILLQSGIGPAELLRSQKISVTVLRPFSIGTMWLWRKHDNTYVPRMNPSYLGDTRDLTALVQGARYVEAMLKDEYLSALGTELMYPEFENCPTPVLPSTDNYWKCVMSQLATTGNHLSGTVPLGDAVDARLRVKGISGVRVMDASVFPEPASGGVSSTILAVANRGFRFMREDQNYRC